MAVFSGGPDERELPSGVITFVMSDIKGSTAAWDADPEAMSTALARHDAIVEQAVVGAGGVFLRSKGEGDSTLSAFREASAALRSAIDFQRAMADETWPTETPIVVRVALHTGEVYERDGNYFGPTLNRAARLRGLADGGQIVVSGVTAQLVQDTLPDGYVLVDLGQVALRGTSRPERAFAIDGPGLSRPEIAPANRPVDAAHVAAIPLPSRLVPRPAVGVVARELEIQTLVDATTRVTTGQAREVVLISGEAGQGKTTIAAEAARVAVERGACVLFGRCEEDLVAPYQLFAEALGHYVAHATESELWTHVDEYGSELVRLVPALGHRLTDLPPSKAADSDTERYLVFAAAVGLLVVASRHRPVVLVFDDLQWADQGSLLLLERLLVSDEPKNLLFVGAYRDSDLPMTHPFVATLAALHRQTGVTRVQLTGFDEAGVLSLMEAAAGQSLDDDGVGLARAVHRETDGNPFFVTEVLRHWSETGAIQQDAAGRWFAAGRLAEAALPESVRVVIGARVGRLGETAQRALSLAAVIGRDFDIDLLARATKANEDDVLNILDAGVAAALLRELRVAGRYSFAHALIQHTLYEGLGPTRRARAHRRVAEALEELCGPDTGSRIGELARHWCLATQPIDLGKALGYSRQAADAALRALAPGDALHYYVQALDLYAQVDDADPLLGIDLTIGLGIAQRQTGDPAFRETLLDAARRAADCDDTDRLVAAALANDRGFVTAVGTTDDDKVEVLELALARLPADAASRALVLALLCSEVAYGSPLEQRQLLADNALEIARASDDDATIVRVLNHIWFPLMVPSMHEISLARTADGLSRAHRLGDPVLVFFSALTRAATAGRAGDIDELDRCLDLQESLAAQLDLTYFRWVTTLNSAWRAQLAGDVARAEQLASQALTIGTEGGEPDAMVFFGAQFLSVARQRGTMGELVPLIEKAVADNPGIPTFKAWLAMAHAEGDRRSEAAALLEHFAMSDFDLPTDSGWLTGMVGFSEAATECRDPAYAKPLFDRLEPWSDQWSTTGCISVAGPVSLCLGGLATVLGRYGEADAYLAKSRQSCNRMGARFFSARTDLAWGRLLAERGEAGDMTRARELLVAAQRASAAGGYTNVERRAAAALNALDD